MSSVLDKIKLSREALASFCQRWQIDELAFFGSVLRHDFSDESDLDVLVTFHSTSNWSLFDHAQMQEEFSDLVKRPVDLISRAGIEASRNNIRRDEILSTAEKVYE